MDSIIELNKEVFDVIDKVFIKNVTEQIIVKLLTDGNVNTIMTKEICKIIDKYPTDWWTEHKGFYQELKQEIEEVIQKYTN